MDVEAAVIQIGHQNRRPWRRGFDHGRDDLDAGIDDNQLFLFADFSSGFGESFGIHECSCTAIDLLTILQRGRRNK